MKIQPRIDRKIIGDIIKKNIKLLNMNADISYDLADCIMLYYIEKKEVKK
ncbi:MAG: hypothetical protein IIA87_03450 [Nanoarchaeota archaeon]|nr:hypothetical protein [Nanoarchaeota archaeon]